MYVLKFVKSLYVFVTKKYRDKWLERPLVSLCLTHVNIFAIEWCYINYGFHLSILTIQKKIDISVVTV